MGCGLNGKESTSTRQVIYKNHQVKKETLAIRSKNIHITKLKYIHWISIFDYLKIIDLACISQCCKYLYFTLRMFYKASGDKRLFTKFGKEPKYKEVEVLTVRTGKYPCFTNKKNMCLLLSPPSFGSLLSPQDSTEVIQLSLSPKATPKFTNALQIT